MRGEPIKFRPDLLPPTSQAANAYELFEDVIHVMEGRPSRVNMTYIITTHVNHRDAAPECGTQGCILGWAKILAVPMTFRAAMNDIDSFELNLPSCSTLFPLNDAGFQRALDDLFFDGNEYPWPSGDLDDSTYAQLVIANIRKFMGLWESALRACKLNLKGDSDVTA